MFNFLRWISLNSSCWLTANTHPKKFSVTSDQCGGVSDRLSVNALPDFFLFKVQFPRAIDHSPFPIPIDTEINFPWMRNHRYKTRLVCSFLCFGFVFKQKTKIGKKPSFSEDCTDMAFINRESVKTHWVPQRSITMKSVWAGLKITYLMSLCEM